jgi:hypothetical protein
MSFWKNPRYDTFEETTRGGDRLRGEVHRNFPWKILSVNHEDAEGDIWTITITCIQVTQAKVGPEVVATLEAKAECQLSPERLKSMGFSPTRLDWMGVSSNEIIREEVSAEIKLKLEQLEFVAKANAKKYQNHLINKYSSAHKQNIIRAYVENRAFSRFSESRSNDSASISGADSENCTPIQLRARTK